MCFLSRKDVKLVSTGTEAMMPYSETAAETAMRKTTPISIWGKIVHGKSFYCKSDAWVAMLFLAPALLGFIVFYFIPIVRGVYMKKLGGSGLIITFVYSQIQHFSMRLR